MKRILYLHGFASGPSSRKAVYFRQVLETAGASLDILQLDAGNFETLTLTGQLDVVEGAAAGQSVSLVGSSMGGYVAALYAARHPEVSRLVLLAPAFRFARLWAERLGPGQMEAWRREGALNVFHYAAEADRRLGYQLMEDAARYEDFPDFTQPALIIHGAHDDVVPPESSRAFAATHPNVRLKVVDSDHELLNVLDDIAPMVSAFLLDHAL